jgi:outer membrane protein TolC
MKTFPIAAVALALLRAPSALAADDTVFPADPVLERLVAESLSARPELRQAEARLGA